MTALAPPPPAATRRGAPLDGSRTGLRLLGMQGHGPERAAALRVTVWGERPRAQRARRAGSTPTACTARSPRARRPSLGDRVRVRRRRSSSPSTGCREVLAETDVLTWWGHAAHDEVADEVVDPRARRRARGHGAGRPALRRTTRRSSSACWARPAACGGATRASASWSGPSTRGAPGRDGRPAPDRHRGAGDVRRGLRHPRADELVFVSSFAGGEVFRGGCCFRRGGRIFYFSPGDQDYPVYHHPDVQRVLANAVRWAAVGDRRDAARRSNVARGWFEGGG